MNQSIKVLSYNIHKGFSPLGRRLTIERIKQLIQSLDADIVMLQEVVGDHKHERYKITPQDNSNIQFEFLADQIWPNYAYGKNAPYPQGHHGNCILSKYPIKSWRNINISTNKLEQRGLLHAVIEWPANQQPLHLLCTHLNLFEKSRTFQISKIIDYVNGADLKAHPLILCGDFNDWRQSISRQLKKNCDIEESFFKLNGKHATTFPSICPVLKLDRIYYRGLIPIHATWQHQFKSISSDHIPLYSEFSLEHSSF